MKTTSKLTDHFERVYALNLDYREDRYAALLRALNYTGLADVRKVRRFRAVSGDQCPPPDWWKAGRGAWGCMRSHSAILEECIRDKVESVFVLEDDAAPDGRAADILPAVMNRVPNDWGQLYLGGQHLKPAVPVGDGMVLRCRNVNRTHAFAVHARAMVRIYQHINHAPDYQAHKKWHIDHQLGGGQEKNFWPTYSAGWWLFGQESGSSNINGRTNPRFWWHSKRHSVHLPAVVVPVETARDPAQRERLQQYVHFGNNLLPGSLEDTGVAEALFDDKKIQSHLKTIAAEACHRWLLPGISSAYLEPARVAEAWPAGVIDPGADLEERCNYPYNGLFDHPVRGVVEAASEPAGELLALPSSDAGAEVTSSAA